MFLTRAVLSLFLIALMGTYSATSSAHDDSAGSDDQLRYYVITAKPNAKIWDMLVTNPVNPVDSTKVFLEGIEGAKLVDYYLLAGSPKNLAIITLPSNSLDASTILYQRIATQLVDEIEIYEVIPAHRIKETLEAAKKLRAKDSYTNKED